MKYCHVRLEDPSGLGEVEGARNGLLVLGVRAGEGEMGFQGFWASLEFGEAALQQLALN